MLQFPHFLYSTVPTIFSDLLWVGFWYGVLSKIIMNKTAIIYARVSSSGSQESRQNTERQVKALLGYAQSCELKVERTFEEHISGAKRNSERLGLQECLRYAKDNQIGVILFSELSRAGRQIWEVLETVKYCVDNKINMYFQKEGLQLFDGDKVNGVMAIYIYHVFRSVPRKNVRILPSDWHKGGSWLSRKESRWVEGKEVSRPWTS